MTEDVGDWQRGHKRGSYTKITDEKVQIFNKLVDDGMHSIPEAAKVAGLKESTAYMVRRAILQEGEYTKKPRGGPRFKLQPVHIQFLKDQIIQNPQIHLDQLRSALRDHFGAENIDVCTSTISNAIRGFHFSMKLVTPIAERGDDDDVWRKRREFGEWFISTEWVAGKVIFLDEAGFKVSSHRRYGRSERGKPCKFKQVCIRSKNITTIATITSREVLDFKILDGTCNAEKFNDFVRDIIGLLSQRPGMDGCVFVMDNVRFHRNAAVEEMIANAGHTLKFLPPYSPFFQSDRECIRGLEERSTSSKSTERR